MNSTSMRQPRYFTVNAPGHHRVIDRYGSRVVARCPQKRDAERIARLLTRSARI